MSAEAQPTLQAASRPTLWRAGALVFFVGLPMLLAAITTLNCLAALEASDAADRGSASATAIIRQLGRLQTQTGQVADTAPLYLASGSASLARAELQTLVAQRVEAAAGHLIETQSPDAVESPEGRVGLQLTLEISNAGLLDLLYGLETGLPILTVTDLSTRSSAETEKPVEDGPLHVEMSVQGFWKKPAP